MIRVKPITWILMMTVCLLFTYGCKDQPKKEEIEVDNSETELSEADFKDLWDRADALWEKKDPNLIGSVYADNFTRISPGGTSKSAEELSQELAAINNAYPDMTLDLERYEILGDKVIVHWSVDGTFTGELAGVKGNGKAFNDIVGVSIFTIEDGKIVEDDSYWDTFAIFGQTGYSIVEAEE